MIGEIYQAFPAARLYLAEACHRGKQGVARLFVALIIRYAREQEESRAFSFFLCEQNILFLIDGRIYIFCVDGALLYFFF